MAHYFLRLFLFLFWLCYGPSNLWLLWHCFYSLLVGTDELVWGGMVFKLVLDQKLRAQTQVHTHDRSECPHTVRPRSILSLFEYMAELTEAHSWNIRTRQHIAYCTWHILHTRCTRCLVHVSLQPCDAQPPLSPLEGWVDQIPIIAFGHLQFHQICKTLGLGQFHFNLGYHLKFDSMFLSRDFSKIFF